MPVNSLIALQPNEKLHPAFESFKDLMTTNSIAVLSTISSKGFPHSTVVWFDFNGEFFRINTIKGFQKEKNIRSNRFVNLFIYNPDDTNHSVEIRGKVIEITELNALEHLNHLCFLYTGSDQYYGGCIPKHFQETEQPLICKIKPLKIVALPKKEVAVQ